MSTTRTSIKIEKLEYKGWPSCYSLQNDAVELIVTADVGPRVIRYGFIGGQNLFKEFHNQLGKSGESDFQPRGGHRLWKAPEDFATTWTADNFPVAVSATASSLIARAPVEPASGLQKTIEIALAQSGTEAIVTHHIANRSARDLTFAPWALTMMAPGGAAIAAFPPRAPYPENLLPTNPLVLWAYTDFTDPRITLTHKYLVLRQDPAAALPQKLGLFSEKNWSSYLLEGDLFVKHAKASLSQQYPDFGCSFETYTNNEFLELETLGPIRNVRPGESVEHEERWSLHRDVDLSEFTDSAIDRAILPLIQA